MSKTFRHSMYRRATVACDAVAMHYSRYDDEVTRALRLLKRSSYAERACRRFSVDELFAYCREHDLTLAASVQR